MLTCVEHSVGCFMFDWAGCCKLKMFGRHEPLFAASYVPILLPEA